MLFDYFAAPSDAAAAEAVEAGPTGRFPVVAGVDPTVALTKLEALLTGAEADESRAGQALAVQNDGETVVVTVTDELQAALGTATEARLREVAGPWSEIEELSWSGASAEEMAGVLVGLAGLARGATERGERLYCWISV